MTLSNATIQLDGGADARPHRPASPGTSWTDREAAAAYGPGAVARLGERESVFLARLGGDGAEQPRVAAPARPRDVGTRVNDLVTLLGDDSFQTRENASRDLLALRTSGLPRLLELMDQAGRPNGDPANNPALETTCDKIRDDLEIRQRLERLFESLESGGPGGAFQDIARAAGNGRLPFAERSAAQSMVRGMSADNMLIHASYASAREVDAKPGFVPLTDKEVKDLRRQLTQLSDQQLMEYVNAVNGGKGWNNFAIGAGAVGAGAGGGVIGGLLGFNGRARQEVSETDLRRGLVASMMLEGRPGGTTVETTASISDRLGQRVLHDAQSYDYDSPLSRTYCARAERYLKYAADHLPAEQAIQTNIALADLYRRPTDQHANGRPADSVQALEKAHAEIKRQAAAGGFMPHEAIELERMATNLQQSNLRLTREQRTQLDRIAKEARENTEQLRKQDEEMNQNMKNRIQNLMPNLMPPAPGGAGPGGANPAAPARGGGNAAPQPGKMMPRPQPAGP